MFAQSARAAAVCPAAGSQTVPGSARNAMVPVEPRRSGASSCSRGRSPGCSCSKCRGWGTFLVHDPRMATKAPTLTDCPTCRATGKVESRLPFRQKTCDDCGGRARVTPAKRDQIMKRSQQESA